MSSFCLSKVSRLISREYISYYLAAKLYTSKYQKNYIGAPSTAILLQCSAATQNQLQYERQATYFLNLRAVSDAADSKRLIRVLQRSQLPFWPTRSTLKQDRRRPIPAPTEVHVTISGRRPPIRPQRTKRGCPAGRQVQLGT